MKVKEVAMISCLIAMSISFTSCTDKQPASKSGEAGGTKAVEGKAQDAGVKVDGVVYSASMSGQGHGVNKAFDKSTAPDDFWEATGCPQWIKIAYPQPKEVKSYELQTGEVPARMPKEWQLQGSDDDVKWVNLDKQSDQKGWKVNEKRIYYLAKPASHKYYRFNLNKGNDPEPMVLRIYEITLQ
ncbi:MAG: discoidin domain-containing protein [Nitrospirae bacterium]|nr:discoidin domain-containing protein [Nitrospirota bacterium]MBF0591458.1 discoidin domain-containing protein [Nitrospirota bacterium]